MCKGGDDRMDPFAMDFDENKEMTDDFTTDMTPEYMFQKFELVLFLLADRMAYLGPVSQLRLQDKFNISDGSVFRIQQELGPVRVGMTRGWFCTSCLLVCCKMLGCSRHVKC